MSAASWPRVQLGEADTCIVYASDAIACNRAGSTVNTMKFPIESTPVYPIAPVAGGNTELAQTFVGYTGGPLTRSASKKDLRIRSLLIEREMQRVFVAFCPQL